MKRMIRPILLLSCLCITIWGNAQNVGDAAPNFSLQKLGGGQFSLGAQEGKVVFIFLFGYGCPHCLANGPNTESGIYNVFRSNPEFVAIGVDTWDGNESGVENFKATTEISYPLCLMGSSLESLYNSTYDRIIIVDKEGIIQYKATANATESVVAQAVDVLEELLADDGNNDDDDKMDDDMMKENMITGLNDTDNFQNAIEIFPNPAKTILNIDTESLSGNELEVNIFDTSGKRALERKVFPQENEHVQVPVGQLRDGLYILRLSTNEQVVTRKFLVMK